MLKRLKGAAVGCAALVITSGVLYAAGNYSTYPIVGGAAFCASTVSGAGGFNAAGTGGGGGATGQGQASSGSLCAQTVPAGPPIVTGNELIPADTIIGSGGNPQTVVLTLASLNALPIPVTTVTTNPQTVAVNPLAGGAFLHLGSGAGVGTVMTAVTVDLPAAPIDGQQFAVSADAVVTTLTMTALNAPVGVTISNNPTVVTPSTTAAYGYRFRYSTALNAWSRLQ